jgi:hypothetical protein
MFEKSKQHLSDTKQTYWVHGNFAITKGFFIVWVGVASILHGIIPSLLPFYTPKQIMKLAELIRERGNASEFDEGAN